MLHAERLTLPTAWQEDLDLDVKFAEAQRRAAAKAEVSPPFLPDAVSALICPSWLGDTRAASHGADRPSVLGRCSGSMRPGPALPPRLPLTRRLPIGSR